MKNELKDNSLKTYPNFRIKRYILKHFDIFKTYAVFKMKKSSLHKNINL